MGEVHNWPGVECMLEGGRRHDKLRVAYNGVSRVMPMPKSPSDHRAPLRRVLREVGASRISKEK